MLKVLAQEPSLKIKPEMKLGNIKKPDKNPSQHPTKVTLVLALGSHQVIKGARSHKERVTTLVTTFLYI
jgi:hypothetical protein